MEKRFNKTLFAWAMVLLVLFSLVITTGATASTTAFAESSEYTSVMDDLQKDKNFKIGDFYADVNDNGLQVIQIAESEDKELFVYVFQPSALIRELTATHISIATDKDNLKPEMYSLTLLSRSGVFGKYLVDKLTVKDDDLRCYEIISIFRKWDEKIDIPAAGGNKIDEVSFEVAQLWSANTLKSGDVRYHCEATEVITVTGKLCGFLRYGSGIVFGGENVDAWFVAFSTDKPIYELLAADVYYISTEYVVGRSDEIQFGEGYTPPPAGIDSIIAMSKAHGEQEEITKTVTFTDSGTTALEGYDWLDEYQERIQSSYLTRKAYVFDRIQTVEEFKKGEKLSGGTKDDLEGLSWVLRFIETPYVWTVWSGAEGHSIEQDVDYFGYHWEWINQHWYEISSVSLLRMDLKFSKDGKVYSLGVVDNMQTSGRKPSGGGFIGKGTPWWVYLIIVLAVLLILLPILAIIFPPVWAVLKIVFKGIGIGIKYLFIGLWWLICLPFKGIKKLIDRRKRSGG